MEKTIKKGTSAQGAGQTPTKKVEKVKSSTDQKNLDNVKEKIKAEKELMYQYDPEDMTGEDKKKFRSAARRTKASYEKKIKGAKPEEKDGLIAEATKWAKHTYTKGHLPIFSA